MSEQRVKAAWQQVNELLRDKAPDRFSELRGAADQRRLSEFGTETKSDSDSDLIHSFSVHDGNCDLSDYTYITYSHSLSLWRDMNRYMKEGIFDGRTVDPGHGDLIKCEWWNPGWIPFAEDSGGNLLCVDNSPGPKGVKGQIIRFETDFGPGSTEFESLAAWLEDYAAMLSVGKLAVDEDGYIYET